MKQQLLKKSLLTVAIFATTLSFSQAVITLVDIVQTGTVSVGETATFTLTYKTDTSGPDIATNTQRLYLAGTGAVSPGFAEIIYTQTNGADATIDVSFPWPAGFDSGTYDYRFFNSNPKEDLDWAPLEENYIGKNKSFGGATFEPETDYLGLSELIVTVSTLSVDENTIENVKFYPNPASGSVNIRTLEGANVEIYNIIGKLVKSEKTLSNDHAMDVSDLSAGVYLVRLTSEGRSATKKLIIK